MSEQSIPAQKPCPVCGQPARKTWCSSACHAISRRTGEERSCLACGTKFYAKGAEVKRGNGFFCSRVCRFAHRLAHAKNYPKKGRKAIHRRVAAEALGRSLQPGEVVHHRNEDKLNYAAENLEVLPSQSIHMSLHAKRGEDSVFAKLTWEKVSEIRMRRAAGESAASLAKEFGVDPSNIRLIVRGKTWAE